MKFLFIKISYFCVLHPLLGAEIKFVNFLENQITLLRAEFEKKVNNGCYACNRQHVWHTQATFVTKKVENTKFLEI